MENQVPPEYHYGAIVFPRFEEDIHTQNRTLFHLILKENDHPILKDHVLLLLVSHQAATRGVQAFVTSTAKVNLLEISDEDLVKLGDITKEEYFARWDVIHPDSLAASNPEVWRIEFKYRYTLEVQSQLIEADKRKIEEEIVAAAADLARFEITRDEDEVSIRALGVEAKVKFDQVPDPA
jgi:hypothetical protein